MREPGQRLGHAIERSERQDFIALPGFLALCLQRRGNIAMAAGGNAQREQRGLQFGRRPAARGRQRGHRPVRQHVLERREHTGQVLVDQQAEHRQAPTGDRAAAQALGQVAGRVGIMPNIQQQRE